jgi:DNA mismatch repair protein MutL
MFIVTEIKDSIVIVDQHAAHERILYERVSEALTNGSSSSQKMLFPVSVPLTPSQKEALDKFSNELNRIGLSFIQAMTVILLRFQVCPFSLIRAEIRKQSGIF